MALGKMLGKEGLARLVVFVREQHVHSRRGRRWQACRRRRSQRIGGSKRYGHRRM